MADMTPPPMPDGVTPTDDDYLAKELLQQTQNIEDIKKIMEDFGLNTEKLFEEQNEIEEKDREKFLEQTTSALTDNIKEVSSNVRDAVLSPLRVVTEPFKNLLGLDLGRVFSSFGEDIKNKLKLGKKNPTAGDVMKTGAQGTNTLYLANILTEIFGEQDSEDKQKALDNILGAFAGGSLGGVISSALGAVGKMVGIGALIAGVVWMVIDGVKGFFMSDEWGTSKAAGTIGGAIGGTGSGWKNAFANAGKWALIGVGIGMLAGGPLGALIGGVIGAVFGGVLGYFGGEKIAGFLDKLGAGFKKAWDKVREVFLSIWNNEFVTKVRTFIGGTIKAIWEYTIAPWKKILEGVIEFKDRIMAIWKGEGSFLKKLGRSVGEVFMLIPRLIWKAIQGVFTGIKNIFIDIFIGKEVDGEQKKALIKQGWELIKDIGIGLFTFFETLVVNIIKKAPQAIADVKTFVNDVVWPGMRDFFGGMFTSVLGGLTDMGTFVTEHIWPPIRDFFGNIIGKVGATLFGENGEGGVFGNIRDIINEFFADPRSYIQKLWDNLISGISETFQGVLSALGLVDEEAQARRSVFEEAYGDTVSRSLYRQFAESMGVGGLTPVITVKKQIEEDDQVYNQFISFLKKAKIADAQNDAIVKADGTIVPISPDDNVLATKNNIPLPNETGGNLSTTIAELRGTIKMLAEAILQLQPQNTTVIQKVKQYASTELLETF